MSDNFSTHRPANAADALAKITRAHALLEEGLRELEAFSGPPGLSSVARAPDPVLLRINGAAALLGVSPAALRKRIERGGIGRGHGLIHRPGRPIEFHRDTSLAKLESETRR